MKQSGWTKGSGIGRDMAGVSEPIEAEGQSPYCKKGLGLDYLSRIRLAIIYIL